MLGRIPPWVLLIVGLIIVFAIVGAGWWFLVKPKNAEIAELEDNIQKEQKKANQRQQAEQERAEVKREWEKAHDRLAQVLDERSIQISAGHPIIGMFRMWREVRADMPRLVQKLIEQSGCVLLQGHPGWQAPKEPLDPTVQWCQFPIGVGSTGEGSMPVAGGGGQGGGGPGAAAMGETGGAGGQAAMGGGGGAQGGGSPLWVAGSLADIERLYKSLRNFPRVVTIRHLGLFRLRDQMDTELYKEARRRLDMPESEIMVAPISLSVWLPVETPAEVEGGGGGAAGGPGAGPGGPGGAGPGMGGAPPGAPPGEGSGGAAPPGAPTGEGGEAGGAPAGP